MNLIFKANPLHYMCGD